MIRMLPAWAMLGVLLGLLSPQRAAARLLISEVMAENGGALEDANGDFPDWIEIYNAGATPIDLEGHFLTDDPKDLRKWSFPGVDLLPGNFLLVFASNAYADGRGKDRQGRLHAPFQLKAKGESVILVGVDGRTRVHELKFKAQRPDLSYGLASVGIGLEVEKRGLSTTSERQVLENYEVGFLKWPTPGMGNARVLDGFVSRVHLSEEHGYFDRPFELTLETSTAGAVIRFTLDGSEPTAFGGMEYLGPITINRTTTFRARAYLDGRHPSAVATRTYLFLDDVIRQSPRGEAPPGWPSGRANRQVLNYGMDPDIVGSRHTEEEMVASLRSLPSLSIVTSLKNLFDRRTGIYANPRSKGRAWERAASFELLDPEGERTFQVDAGLRVRGAWSRQPENPKHALRLVFRKAYGSAKLKFPLFGEEGVGSFDHIDLRTSLNYAWVNRASSRNTLLRDIFCRDTQRDMGQPYTRSRYYHLYLNGHYWGVYMTQERAVAPYAASYMGGDPEDYDVVKSRGELIDGNWEAHREYFDLAMQGFRNDAHYLRVQGLNPNGTPNPAYPKFLDVDNVIDYMILTYYSGNQDGPGGRFTVFPNNFYANFNRSHPDGWKYYAHDMEHTFDVGGTDIQVRRTSLPWRHFNVHWLHEQLVENRLYLRRFKERVNTHFFGSGALTKENALARLDTRKQEIHQAMIAHSARWGDAGRGRANRPYTQKTWLDAVARLRSFIAGRKEPLLEDFTRLGWYEGVQPPEVIDTGADLLLIAVEGEIYYTLDGSDPRAVGDLLSPRAQLAEPPDLNSRVLVSPQSTMRAWPATHGRFDGQWQLAEFDDGAWRQGKPGLGYDDDGDYFDMRLIRFDVTKTMRGKTNSVYMRVPFELERPESIAFADLEMKCDDGFVAFLNGIRVASSGAPRNLSWRSASEDKPSDGVATTFQRYRLPLEALQALQVGRNILAIHGLNVGRDSSDLIMIPRLTVNMISGGTRLARKNQILARVRQGDDWSPLLAWP